MKNITHKGFTLLELLVSFTVFITVSVIIVTVLFAAFSINKKSETVITLRQNGDAAMSQIVRGIRYAKSLDDPESCTTPVEQSYITITSSSDDGQTTYACPDENSDLFASNGATLVDTNVVGVVNCAFVCTQTSSNSSPTITVQFTLDTATGSGFVESTTAIPFKTSVSMRNFVP